MVRKAPRMGQSQPSGNTSVKLGENPGRGDVFAVTPPRVMVT